MAAGETRELERFVARSDDGAYETIIIVHQDFVDAAARGAPGAVVPGLKRARTVEGYACTTRDGQTFEVAGDILRHPLTVRRVKG